jgi:hypothetical protein
LRWVVLIISATCCLSWTQPALKARRSGKTQQWSAARAIEKRWSPRRLHLIVQPPENAGEQFFGLLEERNIVPLSYVGQGWLVVSAHEDADWSDLDVIVAGSLEAGDKISPELAGFEQGYVIAEFHADVTPAEARAIAAAEALEWHEHPDLLPWQLLLRISTIDQLRSIALWDELAYLFPASGELIEGRPQTACLGADVGSLNVGQYVAKVGEGWDGPGRNAATLNYQIAATTAKLAGVFVQGEFERALGEWAKYADITFVPGGSLASPRTISTIFAPGAHGDAFPFDGPGRVLAHTFYPSPPNPEPIAGDLHFDEDENWAARNELDFFSVALHELGHALGLAHADRPSAVMYPFYRRVSGLAPDDIAAIQELYAARSTTGPLPAAPAAPLAIAAEATVSGDSASLRGTVSGGTGEPRVTWSNQRGGLGVAQGGRSWSVAGIVLLPGLNAITVTATDAAGAQAARIVTLQPVSATPLTLSITSPTAAVFDSPALSIALSGSSQGAARIAWANSRGGSGQASGTDSWTTGAIVLYTGSNVIVVTAYSADGRSVTRSVEIRTTARDTVAPSLQINSPLTTSVATSAPSIVFRGTARDNGEVAQITWANANGPSGLASGTSSWTTPPIPLFVGTNQITIRAYDAAGNSSWRSVTVTRR